LVTLHTIGDHVTPVWHQEKYNSKIFWKSEELLASFPIERDGHCTFLKSEIEHALALLLGAIGTPEITASTSTNSKK
jgi:hypothetical protein